jgi:valine dehydrogenase (NAD+)
VGVFDRSDHLKDAGHEQVVFCQDRASGLKAIIAVYSTALGPALGGTRFFPYASEDDAVEDVLKLSKAMAYKAACAGVDLGGGKAVIIGDPARDKSEALLRAYGRFVQSLGGRYYTACDVGTYVRDMDVIAKETDFATGRSPENGGAGVSAEAVERVRAVAPAAEVLDVDALPTSDCDVYAPCALGGSITDERVPALQAEVVCGAANNQLAHPGIEKALADRGILYTPDYVANAGGLVQVGDEALNPSFSFERAKGRAVHVFDTTLAIFELADSDGIPPAVAADRLAERRMAEVGRLRSVLLPGRP